MRTHEGLVVATNRVGIAGIGTDADDRNRITVEANESVDGVNYNTDQAEEKVKGASAGSLSNQ